MTKSKCTTCVSFRELGAHLFELATYCEYLSNQVLYEGKEGSRYVSTETIGSWLKLAAQLEKVDINTWKFADDSGMYCRPAADAYNSDMKHYSSYSTALTRFIFISNALEELYRFVSPFYFSNTNIKNKKFRKASMQASALLDICEDVEIPKYFNHKVTNLTISFKKCHHVKDKELTGMKGVQGDDISYGLHLIRNLRNFIAHGIFPIIENPEWDCDYSEQENLYAVLFNACRVACLYTQILLGKYNQGMQSDDFAHVSGAIGEEFDYFRDNCVGELALKLHLKGGFSYQQPFGC